MFLKIKIKIFNLFGLKKILIAIKFFFFNYRLSYFKYFSFIEFLLLVIVVIKEKKKYKLSSKEALKAKFLSQKQNSDVP